MTTESNIAYSKGMEIDSMLQSLIDCSFDKDVNTREIMQLAISNIGIKEPKLALSMCLTFLKKNFKSKKISLGHRIMIFKAIANIVSEVGNALHNEHEFVLQLAKQITEEMTLNKEILPEIQTPASSVLVALSSHSCSEVMEILEAKTASGVLPHFFVIQTLGNMATNNPSDMVVHLGSIISRTVTFLGLARYDSIRWVIAQSIGQFCEAILEAQASNVPNAISLKCSATFTNYIYTVYEILLNSWINTKDTKLRSSIVYTVGQMVHLIDRTKFECQLHRLITTFIDLYKRHNEAYHVTRAFTSILQVATAVTSTQRSASLTPSSPSGHVQTSSDVVIESLVLAQEFDHILSCLFNQLLLPQDPNSPSNTIKNHNEVKRCFALLCDAFPERTVNFVMKKLDSNERGQIFSLILLRHLVSSCDVVLNHLRPLIIFGLRRLTLVGGHGSIVASVASGNLNGQAFPTVKMELAQTIISMGGHGYLKLEGGNALIEFIVRMCALPLDELNHDTSHHPPTIPIEESPNRQLRRLCENILILGSNSVDGMRQVLWPYLLEFLLPERYTEAVGQLCLCLDRLSPTPRSEGPSLEEVAEEDRDPAIQDRVVDLDYDVHVNVPKPQFLVTRLIVLAGVPLNGNKRGLHVLKAMIALSGNFHENLRDIWSIVIPKLINYFTNVQCAVVSNLIFDQSQWQDLMLKMLAKSLEQVCDEDWTLQLGEAFSSQIPLYDKYPAERGFLYKCLGVVMSYTGDTGYVEDHLKLVYSSVRHQNAPERQGCAACLGSVASRHLIPVLELLELSLEKNATAHKRASGLLGLLKDKETLADLDLSRATLLLSYGHTIFLADPEQVPFRLETCVMKALLPIARKCKCPALEESIIECIDLIGRAVHPDHLGSAFLFKGKTELLELLFGFIKLESTTEIWTDLRSRAMLAILELVRLEPAFSERDLREMITICTDSVYPLPPVVPIQHPPTLPSLSGTVTMAPSLPAQDEADRRVELTRHSLECLNQLLLGVLSRYFSDACLAELLKILLGRIESLQEHERLRALESLQKLLTFFQEKLASLPRSDKNLCCLGELLGHLIPRVADPVPAVRSVAFQCLNTALEIDSVLQSTSTTTVTSPFGSNYPSILERISKPGPNLSGPTLTELSRVVTDHCPTVCLPALLAALYLGLTDVHLSSRQGVCHVLETLFDCRSTEVTDQVGHVICVLHNELSVMESGPSKNGVLKTVRNLANNHLVGVLNCVLVQPLPLDVVWNEILITMSGTTSLLIRSIDYLERLLSRSTPFEVRDEGRRGQQRIRLTGHTWLSALNCLQVFCSLEAESKSTITDNYSNLMDVWLMSCATALTCHTLEGKPYEHKSGAEANLSIGVKPASITAEGLRNFFLVTESHDVIEELTVAKCWATLDCHENFMTALDLIAKGLCEAPDHSRIGLIVNHLVKVISSQWEPQRVALVVFYGSLIKYQNPEKRESSDREESESLVDVLVSHLLRCREDALVEVRKMAVRGLGNVGYCGPVIVQRRATTLLSALLEEMDGKRGKDPSITHEAITSTSLLVHHLTEPHLREHYTALCLALLPACCDRTISATSPDLRAAAFHLLGCLVTLAQGPSLHVLLEQCDIFLVPLVLHTAGPSPDVRTSCVKTLKKILPLLVNEAVDQSEAGRQRTSQQLEELVKRWLKNEDHVSFLDLTTELVKIILSEFPNKAVNILMKCVFYFRSDCVAVQSNSILFAGIMLSHLTEDLRDSISREQICMELIQLLRADNSIVRCKAAEAMGMMHMY